MIRIGTFNELTILRTSDHGLYLGSDEEDVLLPNKYCPQDYELGDKLNVFVYLDHQERPVATNITPKITLKKFSLLQVSAITTVGIFMDWGLEKELMVPYKEQQKKMEEGRWYIVYMDIDQQTNRLYASSRVEKFLQNDDITVKEGEEVDLLVWKKTDVGYAVIINHLHEGLIYENEVFARLNVGDTLKGFIKKIREDKKIDVSLSPIGYDNFNEKNTGYILQLLKQADGFIGITDKSPPGIIYSTFGMSKKAYKKAIGALYKQKKIEILPAGIKLCK
ncbi:MAG: S1 RNA-binding domain-containing protein [Cyclobacteriaceae bacterium]